MTTALLLVIKATLVLLAALGLDLALRRRHVLACAAMWNASMVALLALPAVAMCLPAISLPVLGLSEKRSPSVDNSMPAAAAALPSHSPSSAGIPAVVPKNEPSPPLFADTNPLPAADESGTKLASAASRKRGFMQTEEAVSFANPRW